LILAALGVRSAGAQASARDVRAAAARSKELRLIVSLAERRAWVVRDSADTLISARVAVGSGRTLQAGGRSWTFSTPRGIRTVLSKEIDPVWIRPDWAYVETARQHHLRLDSVSPARPRRLSDGTTLVVREGCVGVLTDSATFEPLPVEDEIVFDGVLYIPPIGSENRAIPRTLGKYRLNLGDGIGLHGTEEPGSIGRAVTHGCVRVGDDDLEWIYFNVPIGTKVYIF
jgi:lipoprotein-anchoring transpeptidase ErfK/SrfK